MTEGAGYVLRVPCEHCELGYHVRYAAAPWVPWGTKKAVLRHIEDLKGMGVNVEGWVVEEGA